MFGHVEHPLDNSTDGSHDRASTQTSAPNEAMVVDHHLSLNP